VEARLGSLWSWGDGRGEWPHRCRCASVRVSAHKLDQSDGPRVRATRQCVGPFFLVAGVGVHRSAAGSRNIDALFAGRPLGIPRNRAISRGRENVCH
jgi:hypothetical protein